MSALDLVRGERGGTLELGSCLHEAAELGQQVAAHARQQVVVAQRGLRRAIVVHDASPAAGPSAIDTATARFSSTIGDGVKRDEVAVQGGDADPVGVLGARCPGVARRDLRLDHIRAGAPPRSSAAVQRGETVRDQQPVPASTVLVERA